MRSRSPISDATRPFAVRLSSRAQRSIRAADDWWIAAHGNAPSRLHDALADAYAALAIHPNLGLRRGRGRRLSLGLGYFLHYVVRPRLREVQIDRIVHESQVYT